MPNTETVLFATKCWTGDWKKFLGGVFEKKSKLLDFNFNDKWLMLTPSVPKEAKSPSIYPCKAIDVENYEEEVKSFFKVKEEDFNGGYKYSIGELTAIYLAKDFDYLCYIQGDVMPEPGDWITPGIKILKEKNNISVVSPLSECNTWHDRDGLDQFFSDQAFLVKVNEFRQPIYSYKTPVIGEYPPHGGDSFERLAARYLRNNNKYRMILKEYYVHHPQY